MSEHSTKFIWNAAAGLLLSLLLPLPAAAASSSTASEVAASTKKELGRGAAEMTPTDVAKSAHSKRYIAVGPSGDVFVSHTRESVVYRISRDGTATIFSGTAGVSGFRDGSPKQSLFWWPGPMAVDKDNELYIADLGNRIIRKISRSGISSTVVGEPGIAGDRNGPAREARIDLPFALTFAPDGSLFFSDAATVRQLSRDGKVSTVAGHVLAARAFSDETAAIPPSKRIGWPFGLAISRAGEILVVDRSAKTLRMVLPDGVMKTIADLGISIEQGVFSNSEWAFTAPSSLALSADGTAFVLDHSTGDILRVSSDRKSVERWLRRTPPLGAPDRVTTDLGHPSDIAMGSDDSLYLVDAQDLTIRRVTMDGRIARLRFILPK
jgi:sugar lactone lactonase YvrE